ncbi:hypothetical protein kac65v162_gp056 [Nodularia phage vB_NspS-kac65v162]|jgi:hypothetical protein|uniref:Uncharacterized protein n=6 Tax=Ravarandavirus TaxID=2843444 RepID=A0A482MJZ3_9CAUD|nr:hypothetical protein HWA92_gp053 [Nodularia phage vB_NpeS-2AV2]YP_009844659.1 hypothetical protein HWC12_gp056 [Nodularia phage vB_NspS-kac65v151]YP_009844872.1 hypothetical protein HWC13_gp063 [Nodularia phage vB_NspS-kac68v161]QBQ73294.1 hypothetical protein kac65v161_gp056 [Nodularia phage vB_NspS-kac65v161]QBQ73500.1 hypothetical protein kac65v162_gp056 [Nodularia phage vB_NspS-kac65v162]QBQ73908.1 hypothetical protein kac68v162_gp060 [Nodularia phage vB_NspS-kac68v162]ALY07505.1 hypot
MEEQNKDNISNRIKAGSKAIVSHRERQEMMKGVLGEFFGVVKFFKVKK